MSLHDIAAWYTNDPNSPSRWNHPHGISEELSYVQGIGSVLSCVQCNYTSVYPEGKGDAGRWELWHDGLPRASGWRSNTLR